MAMMSDWVTKNVSRLSAAAQAAAGAVVVPYLSVAQAPLGQCQPEKVPMLQPTVAAGVAAVGRSIALDHNSDVTNHSKQSVTTNDVSLNG